MVEKVFHRAKTVPYAAHDFLYFFADVDYDVLIEKSLHDHPKFIYNAFCSEEQRVVYNDLEIYLINSPALEKTLANLDIEPSTADSLRERLERASRDIGALRVADEIVRKREKLTNSVLNGLEIEPFFDPVNLCVDMKKLKTSIPNWSNYRYYVDDLIEAAQRVNVDSPAPWSLSRGHDVTEMLSLHVERKGHKGMVKEKIELMLRLACELPHYLNSPMGRKLHKCEPVQSSFLNVATE
ncbi:hypothetical protein DF051_07435 [Burkholderia contaminans]|uniref:DUF4435 domain-containing protein n=1 Tax=Burkholderia contaminans TaxID=488447 RepID=A0A3N8Q8A6_9BURK|nr:hypothetical protein DF051_07435 [Burkholderia contaminans]